MDKGLIQLVNEHYDASALSDLRSADLGMFNRMIHLPDTKPYGFWMDRHGNFMPVTGGIGSHEKAATEILTRANENLPSYNQIDFDEIPSFYDFLLDAGWLRIIISQSKVYWETKPGGRPSNIQMKNMEFMKDFYDLNSVELG